MSDEYESETGIVTRTKTKTKRRVKKPPRYKVLLHNDDYTTREFVVEVLKGIFHRDEPDAVRIMLHVHNNAVGVAGVDTFEVAEMKVRTVEALAGADPLLRGEGDDDGLTRPVRGLGAVVEEAGRAEIDNALRVTSNNRTQAAKLLGINRRSLLRRLQKYGYPGAHDPSDAP